VANTQSIEFKTALAALAANACMEREKVMEQARLNVQDQQRTAASRNYNEITDTNVTSSVGSTAFNFGISTTIAASVPSTIHQIWIGPNKCPTEWIDTWRGDYCDRYPSWKHKLW
jgi:hypothetical protein